MAIPSLSGRVGEHPFGKMARQMNAVSSTDPCLIASSVATKERVFSGSQFEVSPGSASLAGHHIMVLDDTWTKGSRAQSASLALRAAGASRVSVMVMGRWLKGGYRDASKFIRTLPGDYDPAICPVTGGTCP